DIPLLIPTEYRSSASPTHPRTSPSQYPFPPHTSPRECTTPSPPPAPLPEQHQRPKVLEHEEPVADLGAPGHEPPLAAHATHLVVRAHGADPVCREGAGCGLDVHGS